LADAARTEPSRSLPPAWIAGALALSVLLGVAVGAVPLLAYLIIALACVVIAVVSIERLAVLVFWTLPYMVANVPTGSFTLKLPEVVGYLFCTAFFARALIRKERVTLPSGTIQLILYLCALTVAALLAPPVPTPFMSDISSTDRNSPTLRPLSIVIWLGLSWMMIVALYNVLGGKPQLLWKCAKAHILSGGLAAVISVGIYVIAMRGMTFTNVSQGSVARSLVTESGEGFRLAGVAYEPLFLAFYLQTVIPITTVALLVYPKWIPRWLSAICLLAQLTALLLTVSAGGWAGATLALLLLIPARLIGRIPRRVRLAFLTGAVVLAGVVGVVIVSQQSFLSVATSAANKILAGSDPIRQGEFDAGINMFMERPLTGMGPGLASYHFPRYHPRMWRQVPTSIPEVNNLYLNELACGGLLGFILFGWLLIMSAAVPLRALLRHGPHRVPILTALSASLVGCMVQYMSLNALFLIYFCVIVGLTFAVARAAEAGALEPAAR
jgi:O-antigen ligase